MTAGWPVVTLIDSIRTASRQSNEGNADFFSKLTKLYGAALTRNVPPFQYAQYSRFLGADADLADFLMPLDLRGLQHRDVQLGANAADAQNKARFEQICRTHGLPCVPTIAVFDHGISIGDEGLRAWTKPLFVKALTGNKGAGAELWRPRSGGFVSNDGRALSIDEFIDSLRPQNCIVQPLLEDCAALQTFETTALSSLRLVTARGTTIPSTVVAASISLAFGASSLTGHSGAQCGIDVENGIIVAVRGVDDETRDRLVGFALPYWGECVILACGAHDQAFSAFATLGWDLALTADGPILLETNVGWNMTEHQKLTGPLGKTVFSGIIDELLAPAGAGRYPADHPLKPASR